MSIVRISATYIMSSGRVYTASDYSAALTEFAYFTRWTGYILKLLYIDCPQIDTVPA